MTYGHVGTAFFARHPVRVRCFGESHYRYFTSLAATDDLHTIEIAYYDANVNAWLPPRDLVPTEHWAVVDAQ